MGCIFSCLKRTTSDNRIHPSPTENDKQTNLQSQQLSKNEKTLENGIGIPVNIPDKPKLATKGNNGAGIPVNILNKLQLATKGICGICTGDYWAGTGGFYEVCAYFLTKIN